MKTFKGTFKQQYTNLQFVLKVECDLDEDACAYFDSVERNLPSDKMYVDGVGETYATWFYEAEEIN